jgi:hypothetical protein
VCNAATLATFRHITRCVLAQEDKTRAEMSVKSALKRVRSPIDYLVMQPLDNEFVHATVSSKHVGMVHWFVPAAVLQQKVHNRYEVESFAADADGTEYGIMSMVTCSTTPWEQGRFQKLIDPAPHHTMSFKISVVDRVHWQRSSWQNCGFTSSKYFGRMPSWVYGIDILPNAVNISGDFNEEKGKYDRYEVSMPSKEFSFALEDQGQRLLDPKTRTVDGFVDNESALRVLFMHRESLMHGVGGVVHRQPMWSSCMEPSVASLKSIDKKFLQTLFNFDFEEPPVAVWMFHEVPETRIYTAETHVEDENDPASATHSGEKSLHNRVQQKAINRYHDFKDEVRGKTYSDINGTELPR